ncbi:MAG: transporter [Maricaulaceae bacterium]|jgi:hypothetical protein
MKRLSILTASASAAALLCAAAPAEAQVDGARVFLPLPKNTNIVTTQYLGGTANASWSNFTAVTPNVDIESDVYALAYTRVQPVFGRTIFWQGVIPAATIDTGSSLPLPTDDSFVNGFGDPIVGATVNVFGAPGMPAYEWLRDDVDLLVNVGVNVTLPIGTYDSDQSLNVGSNQWKGRFSAPIIKAFGPWVPGQRTTLEVTPSVTVFGDNDDAPSGSISQDPLYSLEAHLTRDMTRDAWVSLDYTWLGGGEETLTNDAGLILNETDGLDASLFGATVAYQINDNLSLRLSHAQTLSESNDGFALEGSMTMVRLSWAWHDVLQRVDDFRNPM